MTLFQDIVSVVLQFHNNSMTEHQLRSYVRRHCQYDSIKLNILAPSFTEVLSSWREKNPDTVPIPLTQEEDDDSCWAIALFRGQNALCTINQSCLALLTLKILQNDVDCLRSESHAVDRLEELVPFMEANYVSKMVVHHRPRGFNQLEQDQFERLIENLLVKGPVVVCFDVFPSYTEEFSGQGVYSPTDLECEMRLCFRFTRHCVVLYGKGVEVEGQLIKEFWEALESNGVAFGDAGFVRLARGRCLIREVVELEV